MRSRSTAGCCSTCSGPRTAATRRACTSSPSASSCPQSLHRSGHRGGAARVARRYRRRGTRRPRRLTSIAGPRLIRSRARRPPPVTVMPVTAPTNPTSTRDRHAVAARFLTVLAGDQRSDELLELRHRLDDGYRIAQLFARPSRARGLATRALALGRRTDVYVGCATTRAPARRPRRRQARLRPVGRLRRRRRREPARAVRAAPFDHDRVRERIQPPRVLAADRAARA